MISWSTKRKSKIIMAVIVIFVIIPFLFYLIVYEKKTSCFDNIQNGNEEGVDCGGTCSEICAFKAANLNVLLAKSFPVTKDVYNVIILVENPNFSYKVKTGYTVSIYNESGIVIYSKQDNITLKPSEKRAVFLPSIVYGGEKISKVFVRFDPIESLTKDVPLENNIKVLSKVLSEDFGQTRLAINLKNDSLLTIKKIEVIGILSDENGNVIQIGKTFVDSLEKREEKKIFITWPESISEKINIIDIYTKILN